MPKYQASSALLLFGNRFFFPDEFQEIRGQYGHISKCPCILQHLTHFLKERTSADSFQFSILTKTCALKPVLC